MRSLSEQPLILVRKEHCISRRAIDPEALKVMYRLLRHGYKAYLVGGGVRDLLLGKSPKDFDIGTDAKPEAVRSLFRNSRIIGRRFRINHVYFRGNKIIEVATFRGEGGAEKNGSLSSVPNAIDDSWGNPHSDALRRDLTINGLFYDLSNFSVIDYVGGIEDLKNGIIRVIGDPETRFREDPVRMLRAVRHASRSGFPIEKNTYKAICSLADQIQLCPTSRVFEELLRELRGGHSTQSFVLLEKTGLLRCLIPILAEELSGADEELVRKQLNRALPRIDEYSRSGKECPVAVLFAALIIGNVSERIQQEIREQCGSNQALLYFELDPSRDEWHEQALSASQDETGRQRARMSRELKTRRLATKQSPLRKTITLLFKPLGVSRKERERMEEILQCRLALLASLSSPDVETTVSESKYLEDTLLLIRFTADNETAKSCKERFQPRPKRKRRRRRRRKPKGDQQARKKKQYLRRGL